MEKKVFGCIKCGAPFEVYPPDDAHKVLDLKKCEKGDCIELKLTCSKCGTENVRYWDTDHPFFATTH